jgi:Flp pilus assembly protein TadG
MPHRRTTSRRQPDGRRGDRGSVAVEMTMLVWPVAVIMAAFIAGAWLLAVAKHDVHAAAAAAARAASQQQTPQAAITAADGAARAALESSGRACTSLNVTVDTALFTHGGHVDVTIACAVDAGGLVGIQAPGTITVQADARSPIEMFRELEGLP